MCQIRAHEHAVDFPTPCPARTLIRRSERAIFFRNSSCHGCGFAPRTFVTKPTGSSPYSSMNSMNVFFWDIGGLQLSPYGGGGGVALLGRIVLLGLGFLECSGCGGCICSRPRRIGRPGGLSGAHAHAVVVCA